MQQLSSTNKINLFNWQGQIQF